MVDISKIGSVEVLKRSFESLKQQPGRLGAHSPWLVGALQGRGRKPRKDLRPARSPGRATPVMLTRRIQRTERNSETSRHRADSPKNRAA